MGILRNGLATAAVWVLALGACVGLGEARSGLLARQGQDASATGAGDLEVLQLRPNFYMIAGVGGNIGVQVGDDGAVVVDAGLSPRADAVVAAIKKFAPGPIRYVINTSADPDHVGGNERISKAGQTLFVFQGPLADRRGAQQGVELPEKNPFVDEMTTHYQVPREAVLGFPETLYPEYRKKIKPTGTPVR